MTGPPCAAPSAWSTPSRKPLSDAAIRGTSGRRGRLARAAKIDTALRYRVNSTSTWFEGTIENLSQTGLLFHASKHLPANALIELVFEMPEEISGRRTAKCCVRAA